MIALWLSIKSLDIRGMAGKFSHVKGKQFLIVLNLARCQGSKPVSKRYCRNIVNSKICSALQKKMFYTLPNEFLFNFSLTFNLWNDIHQLWLTM